MFLKVLKYSSLQEHGMAAQLRSLNAIKTSKYCQNQLKTWKLSEKQVKFGKIQSDKNKWFFVWLSKQHKNDQVNGVWFKEYCRNPKLYFRDWPKRRN